MTEDEAKKKWCPFVRTGLTAGMAVNRHVADSRGAIDGVFDETRCLGSGCMMWKWLSPTAHTIARGAQEIKTKGYCGLSGPTDA